MKVAYCDICERGSPIEDEFVFEVRHPHLTKNIEIAISRSHGDLCLDCLINRLKEERHKWTGSKPT